MAKHELPLLSRGIVRLSTPALVLGLSTPLGCVKWMRDADFYRDELTEVLEDQHAEPIEACYDRVLDQDPTAKGAVVVNFEVEKQTGKLTAIAVDSAQTDAPAPVVACVTDELALTTLSPPDAKTGVANYRWEFAPGSRKRPPADPFAGAEAAVLGCYADHLAKVDREAQGVLVVDYAFDRANGTVSALEVVGEGTTAPAPVVACAEAALRSATIDPSKLEDRNAAGQRSFTLRFEPWREDG